MKIGKVLIALASICFLTSCDLLEKLESLDHLGESDTSETSGSESGGQGGSESGGQGGSESGGEGGSESGGEGGSESGGQGTSEEEFDFAATLQGLGYTKTSSLPNSAINTALGISGYSLPATTSNSIFYISGEDDYGDTYFDVIIEGDLFADYAVTLYDANYYKYENYYYGIYFVGYYGADPSLKAAYMLGYGYYEDFMESDDDDDFDWDFAPERSVAEDDESVDYIQITLYELEVCFDRNLTDETTWDSEAKSLFAKYDAEIPFIKLSEGYKVFEDEPYDDEAIANITIYDYYYDVLLEDYGDVLVAAGFTYDDEYDYYEKLGTYDLVVTLEYSWGNNIYIDIYEGEGGGSSSEYEPDVVDNHDGTFTSTITFSHLTDQLEFASMKAGVVDISVDNGSASNVAKYYSNGDALRLYPGATLTIAARDESVIVSSATLNIVSGNNKSLAANNLEVSGGSIVSAASTLPGDLVVGTITGDIDVSLSGTKGNFAVHSIILTYSLVY